jgi:hypothetical protein
MVIQAETIVLPSIARLDWVKQLPRLACQDRSNRRAKAAEKLKMVGPTTAFMA